MTEKTYNVPFLCRGNSARSFLAKAILDALGAGRFNAYSAGSFPKGEVNPHALDVLQGLSILTDFACSKRWGVPDPAEAKGTDAEIRLAFADAYRLLRNRISAFISLPIRSLDKMSLQAKLSEIGKGGE